MIIIFFYQPMDRDVLMENQQSRPQTSSLTKSWCAAEEHGDDPSKSPYPCSLSSTSSPSLSSSSTRFFLPGSFEKGEDNVGDENSSVYTNLPHLADLTTYMIQDIIRFSKSLQDFR